MHDNEIGTEFWVKTHLRGSKFKDFISELGTHFKCLSKVVKIKHERREGGMDFALDDLI